MAGKEAVVFGAGSIGRGFIGELLFESGYHTTFVEVNPQLTQKLQEAECYPLRLVGPARKEEILIRNISAVNASDKEKIAGLIPRAEVLFTAVGVRGLTDVAGIIAMGIRKRQAEGQKEQFNIIICENMTKASGYLRDLICKNLDADGQRYAKEHMGLVETVVSRMVPVQDEKTRIESPLLILAEDYNVLHVDKNGFIGKTPDIKGMVLSADIFAEQERKLFTHNLGHTYCSYLGWEKGYRYVYEAIEDKEIRELTLGALNETGNALVQKHGFDLEEHRSHIQNLLTRFANRLLGDTIERAGRDPVRKLGLNERLIGAARLVFSCDIKPIKIVKGICAAIRYDNPNDSDAVRLSAMLKEKGVKGVLREVAGLSPDEPLFDMVVSAFRFFI